MTRAAERWFPPSRRLYTAGVAEATVLTLFSAIIVLYLATIVHLSTAAVALSMSVSGAVGLVLPLPIGAVADRFGARRVGVRVLAVQAAGLFCLAAVRGFGGVLVCLVGVLAAMRGASAVRSALVAQAFARERWVGVQLQIRSAGFVGGAAGAAAALAVVRMSTATWYRAALVACGVLCLVAALLIHSIPVSTTVEGTAPAIGRSVRQVLADVSYLSVAATSSLVGLHSSLLSVALPLVVAGTDSLADLVVPAVFLVEAVLTILLQARVGARVTSVSSAVRAHLFAVCLLLPATALLVAGGKVGGQPGSVLLIVAGACAAGAAMIHVAGAVSLGFELANRRRMAAYLGAFSLGRSLQLSLGPVLVTTTVVSGGVLGAVAFAAVLLAAPALVHAAVQRAQRHPARIGAANP